jgi:hypothetical protein
VALTLDRALQGPIEVWSLNQDATLSRLAQPAFEEVQLKLPGADGTVLVQLLRIELEGPTATLLLRCPQRLLGVSMNPMLVVNAPVIFDGRSIDIERVVPEPIELMESDIVGPVEVARLRNRPLGPDVPRLLSSFPLARFGTSGSKSIDGFRGVQLDAQAGEIRFNAPDAAGDVHELRVGSEVALDWYRRTDGQDGNVPVGAIELVEQAPSTRPRIQSVVNPFPTLGGADGESEEAARGRLFSPGAQGYVLPTDWERALRSRLGGQDWRVRAWSHAERALVTTDTWSVFVDDAEMARRLDSAGERTIVISVARGSRLVTAQELAKARHFAEQICADARSRSSRITEVLVFPMTPIWLDGTAEDTIWPTHDTTGLEGELVDAKGKRRPVPVDVLMLDAVIEGIWTGALR